MLYSIVMTIIAEKMVAGGTALGRLDGKAVFMPYALPGETLEIEITESRKDYSFARVTSVLEPSDRRVIPPCPHFGRCGGCSFQMAGTDYQTELRKSILGDALSRAHVEPEKDITVVSGSPWEYRSRFQFHRTREGSVGLKEGASREIIAIKDCPVAVPVIRQAIIDGSIAKGSKHCNEGDRFHVFGYGENVWQEDENPACQVSVAGKNLHFDVRGFFQSNIPMLESLISSITAHPITGATMLAGSPDDTHPLHDGRALFSGKRLLDFYSGVGTFSATLGDAFDEVVLAEFNREALVTARENLSHRADSARFCTVSDERWPSVSESRLKYDCAIVDPPRLGMNRRTVEWLIASGISDVRSVSCDPVTFARDAARLVAGGFALREVTLYDFYPQTHHIETLAFFTR